MSPHDRPMGEPAPQVRVAKGGLASPRAAFAWSVRREIWEHRALYLAPLAVAGIVVLAFLFNVRGIAGEVRRLASLDAAAQAGAATIPFGLAASAILFTSFVVAMFYCLDALYGERRDRSLLFWKSMPVSDRTTVLAKAFVPLAVLPLAAFAIALATQLALLALASAVMLANGVAPAAMWSRLPLAQMPVVMLYGLVVHTLWFAPVYGWLLLVSAWARKAPVLWAVLPVVAAIAVEKIAFGTGHVLSLARYRLTGAMQEAFAANALHEPATQLSRLDPARFASTPGLWVGLAFAALFLAAAIRSRRYREPL